MEPLEKIIDLAIYASVNLSLRQGFTVAEALDVKPAALLDELDRLDAGIRVIGETAAASRKYSGTSHDEP